MLPRCVCICICEYIYIGFSGVPRDQTCHHMLAITANAGDVRDSGSIPGLGRPPGGGHGNPLQSTPAFLPGESHGQRSLVGYRP